MRFGNGCEGTSFDNAIELHDVSAGYNRSIAVKCVSLSVKRGCILGITGSNGSGKTTLLRVIQGLLPAASGYGSILGVPLTKANHAHIQKRSACVFQTSKIDPYMPITAREVVMMGRYGQRGPLHRMTEVDRSAVTKAIHGVDIEHLVNLPYGQLSGGEQQRVNLARALAQEPELLLLDEPTTFLDVQSHQRMQDIITQKFRKEKVTTVIVSHDMSFLKSICMSIVTMNNGVITDIASEVECSYA